MAAALPPAEPKRGSCALQTAPFDAACGVAQDRLRQAQGYRASGDRHQHRWSRALAGFRRADDRLAAFRAYEASLPAAARAYPACAPLEARSDALETARLDAIRRLLRAPAPDLPALALKIELAVDEEIAFFPGGDLCLAAVKADAHRLCALTLSG